MSAERKIPPETLAQTNSAMTHALLRWFPKNADAETAHAMLAAFYEGVKHLAETLRERPDFDADGTNIMEDACGDVIHAAWKGRTETGRMFAEVQPDPADADTHTETQDER